MPNVLEKFLRYVRIETTSQAEVDRVPSTDCQFDLARLLVEELRAIGLDDAAVDEHCYVTATLPSNLPPDAKPVPVVGLIAHMDTSPEITGKNVQAQQLDYRGGDIALLNGTIIPEDDALKSCVGHRLITTDGTTLLGADDKAGVAAIMTAVERLRNENKPHGAIRICFTPDEEVGNGTAFFNIERFGADLAYTVDGGLPGELNCETFTARQATITVTGKEVHPGTAKGIMVNAARVASEIVALLPKNESPETTEGRESFLHPYQMEGTVGSATVKTLLRGFDDRELERLQFELENAASQAHESFPEAEIDIVYKDQYRNMREKLENRPEILAKLDAAARRSGVQPQWTAIRGGTDGSRLTELGLPTPNIYAGGHNFHGPMEWLSVDHLETTVETLVNLAVVWTE